MFACLEPCAIMPTGLTLALTSEGALVSKGQGVLPVVHSTWQSCGACCDSAVPAGGSPERAGRCVCSLWQLEGGSPGLE